VIGLLQTPVQIEFPHINDVGFLYPRSKTLIAFVLSGGTNRGSLQAGAVQALLERGIIPDFIAATSVGATTGIALAAQPSLEGVAWAQDGWRRVTRDDVFPGGFLNSLWRIARWQGSLHDQEPFQRFMRSMMPVHARRFGDLRIPCLVTATVLGSGRMHLFGDDPQDRIIDALMAATAIPPFYPPYSYRGELLVDGAVLSNLPLEVAIERNARTIFALDVVTHPTKAVLDPGNLIHTLFYSLLSMMRHQDERERQLTALARQRGITIHHIRLDGGTSLAYNDFSQNAELIESGYAAACTYLDSLPNRPVVGQRVAQTLRTAAAQFTRLRTMRLATMPAQRRSSRVE
jgi:NTE family protein